MSTKKSTIIIAQEAGRQSSEFQNALRSVLAEASVEIVHCGSVREAIELCGKMSPVSVWMDCHLPDFSYDDISKHFQQHKAIAGHKPIDWFLLAGEHAELDRFNLTDSIQAIANLQNKEGWDEKALKEKLLSSVHVLRVTDHPYNQFSYSWSGKAALGEKEANDRIFGEERFRRLVHNSHDLICVIEEDGFIKYVSESSERILGYVSSQVSGLTIQEFFPDFSVKQIQDFFRKAAGLGTIRNLDARSATGSKVSLELVCSDMRTDPVIRGYVINARDVTKKRETEEKIKFQARLLSNIREAVVGIDADQKVVYLNPAAEKLYKTTLLTAQGRPVTKLFNWEFENSEEQTLYSEFLKENGMWMGEAVQVTSTGRRIHAEISITNHSGQELPGSIIVVRDIKDRKVVENVLHESETRFKSLVEVTSDLVWQVDGSANLTFISPKVADLLGYTQSELIGKPFEILFLHSDNVTEANSFDSFRKVLSSREPFNYLHFTFTDKSGCEKIFELSGLPIFKAGQQFQGYQGVVRDITQRVHADKALRGSLAEKEILIKEIHHRVKNNMQIVSSLLFLQSQFIDDPKMLAKLQESQDRIKSMALVHEKLYQSTDLNRIDFRDYMESLTRHIANSYRNVNVEVLIDMEQSDHLMQIDTAIPCGLILNELVSNAYKHAFTSNGGRGSLRVSFSVEDRMARLVVADDGVGISSTDISTFENTSLGMQLVIALAKQLRGKVNVWNAKGTTFELTFAV